MKRQSNNILPELLERRRLLSANMTVNGTTGDDVISITRSPMGAYIVDVNGRSADYAAEAVHGFVIRAGAGNDAVTIGADVTLSVLVRGGAGNDSITGGPGNDRLFGDSGDDTLVGGDGADRLVGGDGDDTLIATDNDIRDTVEGGSGADKASLDGVFVYSANSYLILHNRDSFDSVEAYIA